MSPSLVPCFKGSVPQIFRGHHGTFVPSYNISWQNTVLHVLFFIMLDVLTLNRNKSRPLFSSAEMFKKPLWQTVCTQIRLFLFWVQAVCFYTEFVNIVRQLFAADIISRRHFQMHIFPGT